MRCELLEQQIPKEAANVKLVPPARGRSSILSEIEKTHASLSAARSKADQLSGRLHATGDPAVLESSAGAADQLYLAVRLAICELVLPSDKTVPIVLDDAFATFDDGRCHLALQWLREAARERQVLLFTCHSREAEFFAEDPEVSIQQLTNTGAEV